MNAVWHSILIFSIHWNGQHDVGFILGRIGGTWWDTIHPTVCPYPMWSLPTILTKGRNTFTQRLLHFNTNVSKVIIDSHDYSPEILSVCPYQCQDMFWETPPSYHSLGTAYHSYSLTQSYVGRRHNISVSNFLAFFSQAYNFSFPPISSLPDPCLNINSHCPVALS